MPKVLFVVAGYSDTHTVGAERIRKYVHYLPAFGFEPHVLTTSISYYNQAAYIHRGFEPGNEATPLENVFSRQTLKSSPSTRDNTSSPNVSSSQTGGVFEGTALGVFVGGCSKMS